MEHRTKEIIIRSINTDEKTYVDENGNSQFTEPLTAYLVPIQYSIGDQHNRYVTDKDNVISKQVGETLTYLDTYITTLSYTTEDLGVESVDEVTDELVANYINSLGLVKNENEIYCVEIKQYELEYDMIHTLTFDESEIGNTFPISVVNGKKDVTSQEVFIRDGISGVWQLILVTGNTTTIPITSTIIQVGHSYHLDGNEVMTPIFRGAQAITIDIANKPLPNILGETFMGNYAMTCTSLVSLSVPDTSNVTSVGNNFMRNYAMGCNSLVSLSVPDTSALISVGDYFMYAYAVNCTSLTSLLAPNTSALIDVGSNYMAAYADSCTSLLSLSIPDTPNLIVADYGFMSDYAKDCTSLTSLNLPSVGYFETNDIYWGVSVEILGTLKGKVINRSDLAGWQALTAPDKTLYINQIQSSSDVEIL